LDRRALRGRFVRVDAVHQLLSFEKLTDEESSSMLILVRKLITQSVFHIDKDLSSRPLHRVSSPVMGHLAST
jgi:hypothetical protein